MAKIKLTKNELKKQKDALKRYNRYLPTILLKKQQLQLEIHKIHNAIEALKKERAYQKAEVYKWSDVFTEKVGLEKLVKLERVETSNGNIAGVDVPVFEEIFFKEETYDFARTPLWVDYGVGAVKKVVSLNARMKVLQKQDELVREELKVTTQRVNLFEKVMIPAAKESIRKVRIYLGDMQTAAVVTGKIAKEKILRSAGEYAR